MSASDQQIMEIAKRSRAASALLRTAERDVKDAALLTGARLIRDQADQLKQENAKDLDTASGMDLSAAMMDRLELNDKRIDSMATALEDVAALPDPVGQVTSMWRRPNGLQVGRVRIPIGVILIIYESRPNVTSDAASLCLKSGNGVILRGGKEAFHSNMAIGRILQQACVEHGLPEHAIQVVPNTDRDSIYALLDLEEDIDLVIPRGGEGLIRAVSERSRIPVLKHYKGVCHVYVDRQADLDRAMDIAVNAKVQRPGVCNAMETLLVDQPVASGFLPRFGQAMADAGVELKGCDATREILPQATAASDEDYRTEYTDLILNIRIVDGIDQAAAHIQEYGSDHTEAIVSQDWDTVHRFIRMVDSSTVVANASTRFADGGELGLGAEIGISTTKLHAFGPMGLEELTSQKFVVYGSGQVRE